MLAAFPWYDLPAVQWANDKIWKATKLAAKYDRDIDFIELLHHSKLMVSQACGLDLYLSSAPIEPIAAPVFDLDCEEGTYYSHIVGDRSGRIAAVNSISSRSGLSALLTICEPDKLVITGSHTSSLLMVQSGQADVAAIDAVTWKIIEQNVPELLAGINIFARSATAPSPPFVVRRESLSEAVFTGLNTAMNSSNTVDARKALFLKGIVPIQRSDYEPIHTEYSSILDRIPEYG